MPYYYHPESDSYFEVTEAEEAELMSENSLDFELCIKISEKEYLQKCQMAQKENKMSTTKINENQVVTGEVRLSYAYLFEARKFKETDKDAKYSVTILIPKTTPDGQRTIATIKAAIQKAAESGAVKHFNGRVPTNITHTLRDGDTETDDLGDLKKIKNPEYENHMYMRLATKVRPKVLDASRQEILDPEKVYSGMYGKVSLTCFPYSGDGKRGISALLNNVMITRDGEPLTSRLTGDEFGE